MQYTLTGAPGSIDFDAFRARVVDEDPAAVVDVDASGTTLRVSTVMTEAELGALAAAWSGHAAVRLRRVPSECCGGCGG